ncbi:MAG: preprotein translocase subunit SecE [Oscillospiraceae bacterium]|nr:preprotein translocase subunit SecE [Oscillospiraceae bacterium]MBP3520689.1 preprotein translocase subunit SecE [Oscillospiraceae bacterium]
MAENEKKELAGADSKAPVKKDKAEKKSDKKPGIFARIKQWGKETKAELKKVQWPTWKQTLNNTLIVLAFCLVVGLCIFLFDLLAGNLFQALINLTH